MPVIGRHRAVEPAFGQVARRLALPVHALAGHLGDFRGTVLSAQLGEQSAAFDAGELPVVAGQNHFDPGAPCFRQQFAGHLTVQHGRLVHDQNRSPVQCHAPVLDLEEHGVNRARLAESVRLQVLGNGIRRSQSDNAQPGHLMRLAHRGKGKTLAGAGAALDQLQPAGGNRVLERRALLVAQAACAKCDFLVVGLHLLMVRGARNGGAVRQRRALLVAHRPRAEPTGRFAGLAVMQRQHVSVIQHRRLRACNLLRRCGIERRVRSGRTGRAGTLYPRKIQPESLIPARPLSVIYFTCIPLQFLVEITLRPTLQRQGLQTDTGRVSWPQGG